MKTGQTLGKPNHHLPHAMSNPVCIHGVLKFKFTFKNRLDFFSLRNNDT